MRDEKFIIICYDISNNKRRTRIAKILEDYGIRVQYSVFECVLSNTLLDELKMRIMDFVEEEDKDKVHFYYLCNNCVNKIEIWGGEEREEEEVDCYVV